MLDELTRGVRRKLRQFSVSLRERGLATTLYWAAFGCLRPNEFCLFATFAADEPETSTDRQFRYEIWDGDRVSAWRHGRASLPPEFFQDRIDGVRSCVVALTGDDVAGLIWIYGQGDPSRLFHLGPRDFELNYGTVLRPYRRHGLFTGILRFGAARLLASGARVVYGGVHAANVASQRAFTSAGFMPIATMRHVAFFRPRHASAGGAVPRPTRPV